MARRNKELAAKAARLGWTGVLRKGGHVRFTHPDVKHAVFTAGSGSDMRGEKNALSMMRRFHRAAQADA